MSLWQSRWGSAAVFGAGKALRCGFALEISREPAYYGTGQPLRVCRIQDGSMADEDTLCKTFSVTAWLKSPEGV